MHSTTVIGRPARVVGIRALIDEAHEALPADALGELLLAVVSGVRAARAGLDPAGAPEGVALLRPGVSPAALAYLRPVELLLAPSGGAGGRLSDEDLDAIERYDEDVASRPRGAGFRRIA